MCLLVLFVSHLSLFHCSSLSVLYWQQAAWDLERFHSERFDHEMKYFLAGSSTVPQSRELLFKSHYYYFASILSHPPFYSLPTRCLNTPAKLQLGHAQSPPFTTTKHPKFVTQVQQYQQLLIRLGNDVSTNAVAKRCWVFKRSNRMLPSLGCTQIYKNHLWACLSHLVAVVAVIYFHCWYKKTSKQKPTLSWICLPTLGKNWASGASAASVHLYHQSSSVKFDNCWLQ